jgi:hypothetical protein
MGVAARAIEKEVERARYQFPPELAETVRGLLAARLSSELPRWRVVEVGLDDAPTSEFPDGILDVLTVSVDGPARHRRGLPFRARRFVDPETDALHATPMVAASIVDATLETLRNL